MAYDQLCGWDCSGSGSMVARTQAQNIDLVRLTTQNYKVYHRYLIEWLNSHLSQKKYTRTFYTVEGSVGVVAITYESAESHDLFPELRRLLGPLAVSINQIGSRFTIKITWARPHSPEPAHITSSRGRDVWNWQGVVGLVCIFGALVLYV